MKEKLIKQIRAEIKGSIENMEYQRDNTKNRTNTAFWEGCIFGENLILKLIHKLK